MRLLEQLISHVTDADRLRLMINLTCQLITPKWAVLSPLPNGKMLMPPGESVERLLAGDQLVLSQHSFPGRTKGKREGEFPQRNTSR